MTTEHDPRAWRVATALAHETGLDWARWAKGLTSPCTCTPYERDGRMWHRGGCRGPERLREMVAGHGRDLGEHLWRKQAQPIPAPWNTDAYLVDCRRREVGPGPLPSLEYRGDGVWWALFVRHSGAVSLQIEAGGVYVAVVDGVLIEFGDLPGGASLAGLVRAINLARVAAEAMR